MRLTSKHGVHGILWIGLGLGLWYLSSVSTIFQLYRGGQLYGLRKPKYSEETTDLLHLASAGFELTTLVVIYALNAYVVVNPTTIYDQDHGDPRIYNVPQSDSWFLKRNNFCLLIVMKT